MRVSGFLSNAILGLALLALAGAPVFAQGLGVAGGEGPLEVTAEDGITWERDKKEYIARGDARAIQDELKVEAEILRARYREAGETSEIFEIIAAGNVVITTPGEEVRGQRALYDLDRRVITITGEGLAYKSGENTITASESLIYFENAGRAEARGNAVLVSPGRRVAADNLTAFLEPRSEEGDGEAGAVELVRVEAAGDVRISTPEDFARGERGVYYVPEERATLEGNVRITREGTQLNGAFAEMNMKTGVSRLTGGPPGSEDNRVKTLIVPGKAKKPDGGAE